MSKSDESDLERSGRIDRRKFLAGAGAGVAAAVAGCSGGGGGGGTTTTTTGGDGGDGGDGGTTTQGGGQNFVMGGKPILGMATPPNTLNPLDTSTAYSWTILDNIYTFGVMGHPDTSRPVPWGFKDWTLNKDAIGSTSEPTITATLRDGLTWSDGKDVTAEDVKFTVDYIVKQGTAGTIAASQFASLIGYKQKNPMVKTEGKRTVHYYLRQKDRAWLTSILGNIIIPKHIWKNVANYSKYTPRKNGGPIGSGPFTLKDYNWGNWFELSRRSTDETPDWNQLKKFLHDEGPFIDALRIELFGGQSALNQAILNKNIDQTYGGLPVEQAAKAQRTSGLKVVKSEDDGWHHHSFNTRRVPLDDPVFRKFMVRMLDQKWLVETLYKGIGAEYGDYATPVAYSEWRPPAPDENPDVPSLKFPGQRGEFSLAMEGIKEARQFLINHPDAKHDYSLGPAKTSGVSSPDNKEIYVNGKPLGQAHTDNNGTPGQGPIQMSYNPPGSAPKTSRIASKWVQALKKVGVPMANQVQSFNSQLPKIYSNEDFDAFEMGWTGIGWNNDHYKQFYGHWGADLKGNKNALLFNPMGYTGADDLIKKQATMMEPKKRQPIVKKVLEEIYQEAPTQITHYANVLQPVTTSFTGRVKAVGGVTNPLTWLNIRKLQ